MIFNNTDTFKRRTYQRVCFLVILLVRLRQTLWREVYRSSGVLQVPHHHGFQHLLEGKSRCRNYRRYNKEMTVWAVLHVTVGSLTWKKILFVSVYHVESFRLSVGVGGMYDCTNIIRNPVACGITKLDLDHTRYCRNNDFRLMLSFSETTLP